MTDSEKLKLSMLIFTKRFMKHRGYKDKASLIVYLEIESWILAKQDKQIALELLEPILVYGKNNTSINIFLQECEEAYSFVTKKADLKSDTFEKDRAPKKKSASKKPSQATRLAKGLHFKK